jgi:fructose transport system substrate-binding protein
MQKFKTAVAAAVLAAGSMAATSAFAAAPIVGLITKTNTNPFFVKMREGAEAKAKELGLELRTYAGKYDGDNGAQVEAIESLVAAGAKGILITPSDPAGLSDTVKRARQAGVLVIALDTPFDPADSADATFATDNFKAGELIGKWAATTMGDTSKAKIATLDLSNSQITVDVLRNQGFLKGFGVDVKNVKKMYDEDDKRIVGHDVTAGSEEGGRKAMENLLQKDPGINVIHTINEPAAAGAYEALKASGKDKSVLVVSVDGGCPGVKNVKAGIIGATSMQFPLLMASLGVEAVAKFAKNGEKPKPTSGLDFYDTGVELVTDKPVSGLPSITSEEALKKCWG